MNEGVVRSPKWLRNFVDFEINTGEDIKGEPSEKRKREIEHERKVKDAERRIKEEERRRVEAEREAERKKKEQEETNAIVDEFIKGAIEFITNNYKKCSVSVSAHNNEITISRDGITYDGKDLKFEITLENTYVLPKFRSSFNYNGYIYRSNFSGLNYTDFKVFILRVIYPYYSAGGYKKTSYDSYEEASKKARDEENKRKTSSSNKSQNYSNDSEEVKKRRRLYNLLKETLEGYQRSMDRIKEWEKKNPGKTHTDRATTEKEIEAVEKKIRDIKDKYKFESLNHLISFIFY
jgi:hypothetical protein